MRCRGALAPDRLRPLVAQAADDAARDRLELPLRPARADDEVVGHRRQASEVEQDDVGGLLVLGQLDDPPGELERRSLGGGRGLGAWAGRRRPARWRCRRAEAAGSVTMAGPPVVSVQRMVADVGRDRIRDEIAQRSTGRRARSQLAGREAETRPVEEGRAVGEVRQVGRQEVRAGVRVAVARRDHDPCQLEDPPRLAPGHQPEERLGREDQDEVGHAARPPGSSPRACRPCTTAPARSISRRSTANRSLPAIASSTIASRCSPAVISRPGLCGGSPAGMNRTRSSPSASAASSATARCATWIGSNVPPKMPSEPGTIGAASRHVRSQGCASHSSSVAADPDGVARRRRPPGAARCRCRAGPARAGSAPPIPRRRSSSGRRSARSARRGRGRRPSASSSTLNPSPIASMRWTTTPAGSGGSASSAASGRSSAIRARNAASPSPVAAEIATRVDAFVLARARGRPATPPRRPAGRSC